jgi:membrane protein implicated in regulation of membrane protease activity
MGSWLLGGVTVLVVAGLAAALVLWAVRRTVTRQEAGLPPLPACPPAGPALLAGQARYLGTTYAPSTVRRFNGHGLLGRRLVGLALEEGGLRVERGGDPWCIPAAELRGVELTSHHAGKEVYADKVLVVDWQLGPTTLRSGFALEEATAPQWAARLRPLVPR